MEAFLVVVVVEEKERWAYIWTGEWMHAVPVVRAHRTWNQAIYILVLSFGPLRDVLAQHGTARLGWCPPVPHCRMQERTLEFDTRLVATTGTLIIGTRVSPIRTAQVRCARGPHMSMTSSQSGSVSRRMGRKYRASLRTSSSATALVHLDRVESC